MSVIPKLSAPFRECTPNLCSCLYNSISHLCKLFYATISRLFSISAIGVFLVFAFLAIALKIFQPKSSESVQMLLRSDVIRGAGIASDISGSWPYESPVQSDNYFSDSPQIVVYARFRTMPPGKIRFIWTDPANQVRECQKPVKSDLNWCAFKPSDINGFLKGTHKYDIIINDVDIVAKISLQIDK